MSDLSDVVDGIHKDAAKYRTLSMVAMTSGAALTIYAVWKGQYLAFSVFGLTLMGDYLYSNWHRLMHRAMSEIAKAAMEQSNQLSIEVLVNRAAREARQAHEAERDSRLN